MFFFAHGLKIRSFQGVPESCRCQSRRGIPACMRRIGHRIVAPRVKNRAAPLQERQLSPVRHAPHDHGSTGLSGMAQRAARRGR